MPLTRIGTINDNMVSAVNPLAGTPTGSRITIPAPFRGQIMEAGFCPNSAVTSAMTLAVAVNNSQLSSAASNFVQFITSTLGTFSSVNLTEGTVCSVIPPNPTYVNQGDAIQFTTSGGNSSVNGATCYCILRGQ